MSQPAPAGVVPAAADLPAAAVLSSHRILEALDPERRGLDVLHRDLFDSRQEVALSALRSVAIARDARSLKLVLRLLTQDDETMQAASARALAAIGHEQAGRLLERLGKLSRSDAVRQAALEGLASLAPQSPEVRGLILARALSGTVDKDSRAAAAGLLLRLGGTAAAAELLKSNDPGLAHAVYQAAENDKALAPLALAHGMGGYTKLAHGSRSLLVRLASSCSPPEALKLLFLGLEDPERDVRKAAYEALGHPEQLAHLSEIATFLASRVDPDPGLEDAALSAIARLDEAARSAEAPGAEGGEAFYKHVADLYGEIAVPERTTGEGHELGWMIARSREYIEYYADEELRQGIVGFLKGTRNYTTEALLDALKRSAVKVEVRHFEGYSALAELLKNPERSGLGLVTRELVIAKLGKRALLYRLIRNLRLLPMLPTGPKTDIRPFLVQVFAWARQNKLFRLAEAALYVLARRFPELAVQYAAACLSVPVQSKILAVAAIRLISELDWAALRPAASKLLVASGDPHILLNLIDALAAGTAGPPEPGDACVGASLQLFRAGENREVLQALVGYLARRPSLDAQEALQRCWEAGPGWKRDLILAVFERWAVDDALPARETMSEFLYTILRGGGGGSSGAATALLLRLGDDYGLEVLKQLVSGGTTADKLAVARGLKGAVTADVAAALAPLLRDGNAALQEALRETLLSASDQAARERLTDVVLRLRGGQEQQAESRVEEAAERPVDLEVDLQKAKSAFRFEKEYVQEAAIMFTDIQGYSKKAQALSTMALASLLQEYEGMLLPVVSSHRGELVKRMGDGHMFVFGSALDAVLAAIRVQKALARFNGYREERARIATRIGVHWGKVVRAEGDVLGNHVNIASRLESSATAGSVLVSDAVHERLDGLVHTRELEAITVKNIDAPIKVYEPYEVSVDLPAAMDPLRAAPAAPAPAPAPAAVAAAETVARSAGQSAAVVLDREALGLLVQTFSRLDNLCRRAEKGEIKVQEIRKELGSRWGRLRAALTAPAGTGR